MATTTIIPALTAREQRLLNRIATLKEKADYAIIDGKTTLASRYIDAIDGLLIAFRMGKLPADVQKSHYFTCPTCDYGFWTDHKEELLQPGEICYECELFWERGGYFEQELDRLAREEEWAREERGLRNPLRPSDYYLDWSDRLAMADENYDDHRCPF
jgi:hypothetical protein